MTLRKFFGDFKKIAADFKWQVDKNGLVRATKNRRKYCPLTALCFNQTQKYFRPEEAMLAVVELRNRKITDLSDVITIADNMEPLLFHSRRALLLGICGLTKTVK